MAKSLLIAVLLPAIATSGIAEEATKVIRQPVSGVSIVLSTVPHGEEIPLETGKDGRFETGGLRVGTWTTRVTVPEGFLETWIEEELSARGWERVTGDEPVEEGVEAKGRGRLAHGGAERFAVTARTPEGQIRVMRFVLLTTIDKTISGPYEKTLRWQFVEGGLSFKYKISAENEGVISGVVERVLTIE